MAQDSAALTTLAPSGPTEPQGETGLIHRSPWGPFEMGVLNSVRAVPSILARHAARLEIAGIRDTKALWDADPIFVARTAHVARDVVEDWQCSCELMAIRSLDPRYVESLVHAGVGSINDLCSESAPMLLNRLRRPARTTLKQGRRVVLADVQGWIDAANRHKGWTTHIASPPPTEA